MLNVHISWCVDVSNDVSLSDSVGRSCRRLSVGESCRVSSDGVRDSAGYGHRSVVWYGLLWYGMGIAPSSSTMPMPIHSEEMYSGRARLHRHGSSADRGTSRHSSRRCDSIVSNRVNTSSSLRAAPQLPFVGKGKRRINLSSEQRGQDTHTGSCCSSRMIIFSKEWHFLEGYLDPYHLATP